MSDFTRFSAEALAKHKDWKLLTGEARHQATGRRAFAYQKTKGKYHRVYITDRNMVVYFHGQRRHPLMERRELPETYAGFIRMLDEFAEIVKLYKTNPPREFGWDGGTMQLVTFRW